MNSDEILLAAVQGVAANPAYANKTIPEIKCAVLLIATAANEVYNDMETARRLAEKPKPFPKLRTYE
jgi:hypothetical protein